MNESAEAVAFTSTGFFGGPRNVTTFTKKAHLSESHDKKIRLGSGEPPRMRHGKPVSRREFSFLSLSSLTLGNFFQCGAPRSAQALSSPFAVPEDLTKRLKARITKEPEPKLYQNDIFYPDYFAGLWRTESTLLAVDCPAGYKLFGRPGSFEAAKEVIDKPLQYQSRFIRIGNVVISDRPFNVTSIAKASMGESSVLECSSVGSTQNRLTMTLVPSAAEGAVFNVDLRIIARQQKTGAVPDSLEILLRGERRERVDGDHEGDVGSEFGLYTSETMRQEVRPNTDDLRVMPLIKDVETSSLFITDPRDQSCIRGWQKTNVYLTKSDLRYPDARGRPVDVRWYRVKYFRE